MPIYIAKSGTNEILDIVLAKNEELAKVFWQGAKVPYNSIRTISEQDLKDHPTGVIPILKTKEIVVTKPLTKLRIVEN